MCWRKVRNGRPEGLVMTLNDVLSAQEQNEVQLATAEPVSR